MFPRLRTQGEAEREIAEDDLTTAFYREGSLDVIDMLREQFQLALPMKPLVRGVVPRAVPGVRRQFEPDEMRMRAEMDDPRLAPLKALLNREKEN